jgi:hypothetical protein
MMKELRPTLSADELYPPDSAFMARTNLFETRMLGFTSLQLDTVTTLLAGALNGRSAMRHEAGAGPEVLAIYERAGMVVAEDTRTYRTAEEAEAIADELIREGKRLFWSYPPPDRRFPDRAHLVTPELYRFLNAKTNLASLVPPRNLPRRRILSHEELAAFEPTAPLFLKSAGDAATGWGFAVRPCPDKPDFDIARRWFLEHRESVPAVIAEEAVALQACWCAGIAVTESGAVCFGGAEQLFHAPARQSGSMIDPDAAFPPEGRTLAEEVGLAAQALGFRGTAGLDIGLGHDGRLLVFDPNFRINASTHQLLLHDSAAARSGLRVSLSFQTTPGGPFKDLAARLEAPTEEGWFVPTRLFNGEKHLLSEGRHIVTGFVLGSTREEVGNAAHKLEARLS